MAVTDRESAIALYSFLKEFAQLRTSTIFDVSRYEQVIWAADVPRESGCDCIAWRRGAPDGSGGNGSDEVWLEIRKPSLTQPPEPPESVRPWVQPDQIRNSSLDLPELRPTLVAKPDPTTIVFQDQPGIASKRLRIAHELCKRLMWGEGRHTFPDFAGRFMTMWGDRPGADSIRSDLREWYELARGAAPPWQGEMSSPAEIDQWYQQQEGTDVSGDRDEGATGEEPRGVPPTGREREAEGVPRRPEPGGEEAVRPTDEARRRGREPEGDGERGGDRADRGRGREAEARRGGEPDVSNRAFGPGELNASPSPVRLEDHPEVRQAWDAYIEDKWWPWAERDRREQDVQRVYTDLFSMYQRQQRLGESFEIIFGLGFLSWRVTESQAVNRHLVAARVSVSFNPEDGVLTVTPAGEGARPSLEQDMLDPQHRPHPQELRSIEETLEMISESLWAAGPIDGLLKSWVHSAAPNGTYCQQLDRPQHPGSAPVVHLAPALILRRRTERSFIRAFQEIIDQLDAGEPVPAGVSRFVSASNDHRPSDVRSGSDTSAPPQETYFPLPANDAQRQIVQRLATNQGVLVQGPPGTGKSHTIVNLICHALASGQRVLVTSHAVRALRVLRRMMNEQTPEVAPLSVVLLGDDRESLRSMEESVQGITTKQNTWTATESRATISSLEGDLDRARRREAKALADLRAIREQETRHHQAKFGYSGTLAHIAQTLHGQRESLSWIPDDALEDHGPPLFANEFTELLSLLRNQRVREWETGGWVSVDVGDLPTTEGFEGAVRIENDARAAHEATARIRQRREYEALEVMVEADRRELAAGLQRLISLIEQVDRRPLSWTGTALKQILGDFERTWRQLHEDTSIATKSLAESARWLDANPITPHSTSDLSTLHADANDLFDHFEAGGRWGFGPFRTDVVKRARYIRHLKVGGRPCDTTNAMSDLVRRTNAELKARRLRERWARYHDFSATTFTDLATELHDLCEPVEDAFTALKMKTHLLAILHRTPGVPEPDWTDPTALSRLRETLGAIEVAEQYDAARAQILQALEHVNSLRSPGVDPAWDEIRVAVVDRDKRRYEIARQQAADNAELSRLLDRKRELLDRLTTPSSKAG